jgi:N-methylhydantoinase A
MCNAVRLVSTSKGYDPRDFALVAFGGAGPLHAAYVAQEMDIPRVIIPPYPGVNSALGCLLVDVEHDLSQTFIAEADPGVEPDLEDAFVEMEEEIGERLDQEGIDPDQVRVDRQVRMRYAGQWRSLEVTCSKPIDDIGPVKERFHEEHERAYAYSDTDEEVEIYGLNITGQGIVDKPSFPEIEESAGSPVTTRQAYFESTGGYVDTDIYERSSLGSGTNINGPAIVQQMDSTVMIPPKMDATVDDIGNIIIEVSDNE